MFFSALHALSGHAPAARRHVDFARREFEHFTCSGNSSGARTPMLGPRCPAGHAVVSRMREPLCSSLPQSVPARGLLWTLVPCDGSPAKDWSDTGHGRLHPRISTPTVGVCARPSPVPWRREEASSQVTGSLDFSDGLVPNVRAHMLLQRIDPLPGVLVSAVRLDDHNARDTRERREQASTYPPAQPPSWRLLQSSAGREADRARRSGRRHAAGRPSLPARERGR